MVNNQKEKKLVNCWILNELAILQRDYFANLEEKKINFVTTNLIKFTREKLSNEYLELIKISPWDENTKKTLLFVYQQLLIMLHPATPFITEHIYQNITQQEILNQKNDLVSFEKENNNLWQVDCLLLLISSIRNFPHRDKVSEFYLEFSSEWDNKFDHNFEFNQYLEPLAKSKVFILKKNHSKESSKFDYFLDLSPFGVLWYQEQINKKELTKQLEFYEKELERSNKLLSNDNFRKKAPPQLIEEEEKKLIYYKKQKENIKSKLLKS